MRHMLQGAREGTSDAGQPISRGADRPPAREQELSGQTVASFIRRNGISRHTFYRWRKKYGGLTETEAIRLKRLERENARLKGLLADRELELEVLKEINAKKWSA